MSGQRLLLQRLLALALGLWLLLFVALLSRPVASLDTASGLYAPQQRDGLTYHWTGNRVRFPLASYGGPAEITLSLGPARWAERSAPRIVLSGPAGPFARFDAPDELRHYRMLLPPQTPFLQLDATVDKPPGREPRWLGVTIYGLAAEARGLPLPALAEGGAYGLACLFAALGLAWSLQRGYAAQLLLFTLALALRLVQLERTPPGWRVDEVVSLVDAWNLARTGRDHLGNLLPLGAFEALGDWISPLLTYLEVPLVAFFGPEPLVGRLVVAGFGSLAAPLCYALGRALGLGRAGAICAGLAAALSPWQIFMGRIALPPALVPTCWAWCMLAGVLLLKHGDRRAALHLALAAGIALYAYPTLKLAVPLLVAVAIGLALLANPTRPPGWKSLFRAWLPAALLLALLWAPFVYVTLFNPASATRLGQAALRADGWSAWLGAWWNGYRVYFLPDFYYRGGDGSSIRGVPGFGLELWATLPLVLFGGIYLLRQIGSAPHRFILLALLIAPLAASLTLPSPHTYRAAPLAPLYALLVGYGVAFLFRQPNAPGAGNNLQTAPALRALWPRWLVVLALFAALLWQGSIWWRAYTEEYPALQAALNQDGLRETMERAVGHAPQYDEIWVSYDSIDQPYLFVLAAQPTPPAATQALIRVERRPNRFNAVTSLGAYRFVDTASLPLELPTLEAVPGRAGGPGYVVQEWASGGKRILVVRKME